MIEDLMNFRIVRKEIIEFYKMTSFGRVISYLQKVLSRFYFHSDENKSCNFR